MRRIFHVMATLASTSLLLGACGRNAGNETNVAAGNGAAASPAPPAANESRANSVHQLAGAPQGLPGDFPSRDRNANGADCYVYLSMAMQAPGNGAGYDAAAMGQARDQWRADLRLRLSETETQQLTGSNVNPLAETPAARRDAAARWCVEHAPVVDPA